MTKEYAEVPVTGGLVALCDWEDLPKVVGYTWYLNHKDPTKIAYVTTQRGPKGRQVRTLWSEMRSQFNVHYNRVYLAPTHDEAAALQDVAVLDLYRLALAPEKEPAQEKCPECNGTGEVFAIDGRGPWKCYACTPQENGNG